MGDAKIGAVLLLLLQGAILMGALSSAGAKACPLYCLQVDYVTCASSGEKKLASACNCCLLGKHNCTLHISDGSSIYCP